MTFIYEFIIKFYKFICNNNIYFFEIPNEKSIFFCNSDNILKNFYIYFINTMDGFIVEVIFKYKWVFFLIMEYKYSYYIIYTKYGSFKCSREFKFFDFDDEFKKNALRDINFNKAILWSEKIHYETDSSLSIQSNLDIKTDNIIKDLEESKINFINIYGQSCYQSAYLQGFIHILIPKAIKYLINKKENKESANFINLDKLKNNNEYNNAIIDIAKEVINKKYNEVNKNDNKNILAKKLYYLEKDNLTDFLGCNHEGPGCQILINNAIKNFALNALDDEIQNQDSLNLSKKPGYDNEGPDWQKSNEINNSTINALDNKKHFIDAIEIQKSTIISEIMKITIEDKNYLNIVVKLDENNKNDKDLDLIKLINNCKQIKKFNNEKRKINKLSDIIYIIIDRIKIESNEKDSNIINAKLTIQDKIFYNNKLGNLSEIRSRDSISYELKFIIGHKLFSKNSGHYIAYLKIQNEWYIFNDLDSKNAFKIGNPAEIFAEFYPVCFFYDKSNI